MTRSRISPAEPISELKHIPIIESGEELVDFLELCPALILDRPRFKYTRAAVVRKTVAERLCAAAGHLPPGYRLAVLEGWRPPYIQRRMYLRMWEQFRAERPEWSENHLRRVVNRYTAPLNPRVPPPHTTGGAVDVFLADSKGRLLDHASPFSDFDPDGFSFDAPGISEKAREHRRILADSLLAGGLTNYPSEYWHWSYGDQGWAYRGGHSHAIYGTIQPDNWTPPEGEDIDRPLEWADFRSGYGS